MPTRDTFDRFSAFVFRVVVFLFFVAMLMLLGYRVVRTLGQNAPAHTKPHALTRPGRDSEGIPPESATK